MYLGKIEAERKLGEEKLAHQIVLSSLQLENVVLAKDKELTFNCQ